MVALTVDDRKRLDRIEMKLIELEVQISNLCTMLKLLMESRNVGE